MRQLEILVLLLLLLQEPTLLIFLILLIVIRLLIKSFIEWLFIGFNFILSIIDRTKIPNLPVCKIQQVFQSILLIKKLFNHIFICFYFNLALSARLIEMREDLHIFLVFIHVRNLY